MASDTFIANIKMCARDYQKVDDLVITSTYEKPITTFDVTYKGRTKFQLKENGLNSSIIATNIAQKLSELIPDFYYKVNGKSHIKQAIEKCVPDRMGFVREVMYNKTEDIYKYTYKFYNVQDVPIIFFEHKCTTTSDTEFLNSVIERFRSMPEIFL